MVKTWQDRTNDDKWRCGAETYMQQEIDELRTENERLKKDLEITKLGAAKTMQEFMRENRGLREAAQAAQTSLQNLFDGSVVVWSLGGSFESRQTIDQLRAALGEKS